MSANKKPDESDDFKAPLLKPKESQVIPITRNTARGDESTQNTDGNPLSVELAGSEKNKNVKKASENIILSSVRELSELYTNMDDLRGELRARGVQGQATNVMVEMAFHNRKNEMQGLIEAALQSSRQAYGHGAISREELEETLDSMLALEKDVAHTRKLCKQRGLDLQVINFLTQLVRQNPGDGGEKAINKFLGYAVACGIELSGIDEITQKYTTEVATVLPDIQRREQGGQRAIKRTVAIDVFIGLALTIGLMALLV